MELFTKRRWSINCRSGDGYVVSEVSDCNQTWVYNSLEALRSHKVSHGHDMRSRTSFGGLQRCSRVAPVRPMPSSSASAICRVSEVSGTDHVRHVRHIRCPRLMSEFRHVPFWVRHNCLESVWSQSIQHTSDPIQVHHRHILQVLLSLFCLVTGLFSPCQTAARYTTDMYYRLLQPI